MAGKDFVYRKAPLSRLGVAIALALGATVSLALAADDIVFNTDVLDVKDRANIDLSQFARGGFIMPGSYTLTVHVNQQELPEQTIVFAAPANDPKGSVACLSPELVKQFGLKDSVLAKLRWHDDCMDIDSLKGMTLRGELATSSLYLSIPQAYLEYSDDSWDPPSRWDEGIPGVLLDYNLNGQSNRQQSRGTDSSLSGNGTVGGNLGAWRLRADWQGQARTSTSGNQRSDRRLDWSRYYAYRALPTMGAKLTLGEDYLNSTIFDSFRFTGASLVSDDAMLPPNLRGYAPEVVGVAKTNARVVVSQQGRVLYETQVAAGPFRIQDLNDAVTGALDVRVEEQDGSVQQFSLNTASIPYLSRPGTVRYKLALGQPSEVEHRRDGPAFATGEFSWGVSNGWSLYGGGIGGREYNSLALGTGRDLMAFGALSFDITASRAELPQQQGTLSGTSYRLNYAKNFEEYDSQVTFAAYRFSERNYMSMADYLVSRLYGARQYGSKEMYTVILNKQFRDLGLSAYLNYIHQTYWERPTNDRYNLSLSRYFDVGQIKNVSLSLSAYRNQYNQTSDNGMTLSLSLPWGNSGTVSYNAAVNRDNNSQDLGYYDRIDEHNSYQMRLGAARRGATASGFFTHSGDNAELSSNLSYQANRYTSLGLTARGGMTATLQGTALHRMNIPGGTRLMLDTQGVPDVPVRGQGPTTRTNAWGKAVVPDVNSYYRNRASIDLQQLGDNVEASRSVAQATLTEGAIGYRRFEVVAGEKAMAVVRLADGSTPPFGATVLNARQQDTGIISDDGSVYLSGIQHGDTMTVHWDGAARCEITLPDQLPALGESALLLPCRVLSGTGDPSSSS
ncbi:outer membrane usher protein [Pseudomonas lundensis]|uniref:outer membrane usher protein n=1 Tax=Serratia proteamaculans TaxID=28151 RepID=UPI002981845B|nr:outer membrane usher protein [Serratia proteamaculans]MDW5500709.1 outer membrane usher protein [Serratia proteamaculans]MDW5505775.1 outer membrane usher protein [Pseudomonas lundensis]